MKQRKLQDRLHRRLASYQVLVERVAAGKTPLEIGGRFRTGGYKPPGSMNGRKSAGRKRKAA